MNASLQQTLGSLVAARPNLGPLLASLGLDFCCGGHRTLEQAARERGLDPTTLVTLFDALPQGGLSPSAVNAADLPTEALIDHIVSTHHAFVRRELPRLVDLSEKVARAHGPDHPELLQLQKGVLRLKDALGAHLEAEERELFPVLKGVGGQTSAATKVLLAPYFAEHEEAGDLLTQFRSFTADYALPSWGCATYRALMEGLAAFETDLHQHVHLENNVLFSRL